VYHVHCKLTSLSPKKAPSVLSGHLVIVLDLGSKMWLTKSGQLLS